MKRHVLVARLDSIGDVLICGPAVRAIAATASVTMLCGPRGAAAARLLPGVDDVLVWDAPWISAPAVEASAEHVAELIALVGGAEIDDAVIFTSFHQSPLPLALVLRLTGIDSIAGASVDYAGSLLDVRLRPGEDFSEDQPEPLRAIAIAAAAGFELPRGDDGRLHVIAAPDMSSVVPNSRYVVVHPGASAPARAWSVDGFADVACLLRSRGIDVVVTGGRDEGEACSRVAEGGGFDLSGSLSLAELAGVIERASAIIVGNTGPAHLAAAVGTPVVSLFSPVVPAIRWAPYGVRFALLGDQDAPCRNSRARECPIPGHPCLSRIHPEQVVDACVRIMGSQKANGAEERIGTERISAEATA
jgi:ADP-heptose:LPS heptosyltransferase